MKNEEQMEVVWEPLKSFIKEKRESRAERETIVSGSKTEAEEIYSEEKREKWEKKWSELETGYK